MAKSSSEILNELFHTFNTSFDETEALQASAALTSSKSKKKKKHSKKKKSKDKDGKVKKKKSDGSSSKSKEKSKSRSSGKDKEKPKSKKKSRSEKELLAKVLSLPPPSPVLKPTYKATKLVLDIEEGEILEDINAGNGDSTFQSLLTKHDRISNEVSKAKKRKRLHSNLEEVVDINEDFLSHKNSSSKTRRKSEKESNRNDDDLDLPRNSKSSRSRQSHQSKVIESSVGELSYHSKSVSPKRSRTEKRGSSRNHQAESPVSRRIGQTSSGIVWRQTEAGIDTNYENVDRTFYFNDARRRGNSHTRNRKSQSRSRSRSQSRTRNSSVGYSNRKRDFSSSRYGNERRRGRSRSRSLSRSRSRRDRHPDDIIDKAKLLEIARHNATKLMKNGVLPSDIFSRDQIIAIRAGGKSVDELTNYCQRLAKRDALGIEDMSSGDSGNEGGHEDFIHHPFLVKDRAMPSITMNIRNAIPLPVRSAQELAIENAKLKVQFPVSSGTQHRLELEWKPVDKDGKEGDVDESCKTLVSLDSLPVGTVAPMPQIPIESIPLPSTSAPLAILPPPEAPKLSSSIKIDPPPLPNLDIGAIISVRLRAMRRLQENPEDVNAKQQLEEATQEMKTWAETKALEPKFLSAAEIAGGPQAWAKKDQLKNATAVSGGMGMHLLQRMGWRPGEGLGKNKEGGIEPLALDVKMDKKGLTATTEMKSKDRPPSLPMIYDLSGKHPVSALMELCVKRKWGPPSFDLCFEHGPPHKKQFVYKVVVNGVEYQPCVATNNKKMAKSNSAAFCLQSLGLLPTAEAPSSAETLRTVPDYPPETMGPPYTPGTSEIQNPAGLSRLGNVQAMKHFIPPLPQASSHTLQTVLPQPSSHTLQTVLPQPSS